MSADQRVDGVGRDPSGEDDHCRETHRGVPELPWGLDGFRPALPDQEGGHVKAEDGTDVAALADVQTGREACCRDREPASPTGIPPSQARQSQQGEAE